MPDGFFDRVVAFAREHDLLVVHDSAYSELTYDGYVAPSFLATPGAMDVGVEVFSLSKGWNMTGWRCAAIAGNADAVAAYWKLKTNVDSGLFEAVQLAGAEALTGPQDSVREMCAIYMRRRDLVIGALREIGIQIEAPKGTIYVWAPVPDGSHLRVVLRGGAGAVGRGRQPGLRLRPQRRGLLPHLADGARRPAGGGGRADAGVAGVEDDTWLDNVSYSL